MLDGESFRKQKHTIFLVKGTLDIWLKTIYKIIRPKLTDCPSVLWPRVLWSENWSKFNNIMTFWHFSYTFTRQNSMIKLNFMVVLVYIGYWRNLGSYMYFFGIIRGYIKCMGSENGSKLTHNMTFGHFSYIFISPKLDMNTFSGSVNLWRLLVESKPLYLLFDIIVDHYSAPRVQIWSKLIDIMTFRHFL